MKTRWEYIAGFLVGGATGFVCARLHWPVWALIIFAVVVFGVWYWIISEGGR